MLSDVLCYVAMCGMACLMVLLVPQVYLMVLMSHESDSRGNVDVSYLTREYVFLVCMMWF